MGRLCRTASRPRTRAVPARAAHIQPPVQAPETTREGAGCAWGRGAGDGGRNCRPLGPWRGVRRLPGGAGSAMRNTRPPLAGRGHGGGCAPRDGKRRGRSAACAGGRARAAQHVGSQTGHLVRMGSMFSARMGRISPFWGRRRARRRNAGRGTIPIYKGGRRERRGAAPVVRARRRSGPGPLGGARCVPARSRQSARRLPVSAVIPWSPPHGPRHGERAPAFGGCVVPSVAWSPQRHGAERGGVLVLAE